MRDMAASTMSPVELPDDVAIFLKGSRYCETDEMGALA